MQSVIDYFSKLVKSTYHFSFGPFDITIQNPLSWLAAALVILFLFWKWGIAKTVSCIVFMSAAVWLMFKADAYILKTFGTDEGYYYGLLTKLVFFGVITFIFIYYAFVRKD